MEGIACSWPNSFSLGLKVAALEEAFQSKEVETLGLASEAAAAAAALEAKLAEAKATIEGLLAEKHASEAQWAAGVAVLKAQLEEEIAAGKQAAEMLPAGFEEYEGLDRQIQENESRHASELQSLQESHLAEKTALEDALASLESQHASVVAGSEAQLEVCSRT